MNKERKSIHKLGLVLGLTKGEGEWPAFENLTPSEKKDPRKFSTFYLVLEENIKGAVLEKDIRRIRVLYDGITPIEEGSAYQKGLSIKDGTLTGRISPILEIELKKSYDTDIFCKSFWSSTYKLMPKKQGEPFYAEDWNGYSRVLTGGELKGYKKLLKTSGVYCGMEFSLKELSNGTRGTKFKTITEQNKELQNQKTPS